MDYVFLPPFKKRYYNVNQSEHTLNIPFQICDVISFIFMVADDPTVQYTHLPSNIYFCHAIYNIYWVVQMDQSDSFISLSI